ncbi:MAG TPA: hypothetical protein VGA85_00495 [Dehalococcoidales bacterium]|jgi:hypothetical protein
MVTGREEHMSYEELKKRLGVWAGFKWNSSTNSWTYPSGKQCDSPDFLGSLDSVFHWLLPHVKLIRIDFMGSGISPNGDITEWQVGIISYAKPKHNQVYGFAESPSEALCRAIHNLISDRDGTNDIRVATDQ